MDGAVLAAFVMVSLTLILVTGLPIAFCLFGLSVLFDLIFLGQKALYFTYSSLYGNLDQELFIAIPLFVMMASLLESSGIASDLYATMHKWMSGLRGGLAMGTAVICSLIDAMSGLGATATLTMGMLAMPEMMKRGYGREISMGCIPCGGALGPLIPPSVVMIMLGGLTGLSVGKLFMGGIIPGVLITFMFCLYIGIRCLLNPEMGPALPREERGSWREKFVSLRGTIFPILLVVLIMGGIYTGIFTPTEAGGIGAAGTFIIVIGRRKMTWENLKEACYSTIKINGMVLWLLVGGTAFSSFLNFVGVSSFLADVLGGLPLPNIGIMSIMLIISLFMGCFIDAGSALMLLVPVFFPVVRALDIDPLYFGLNLTISLVIGYVTPPFGINIFYIKGIVSEDITLMDIYKAVFPFMMIMVLGLVLCVVFPPLVTWLPGLMK